MHQEDAHQYKSLKLSRFTPLLQGYRLDQWQVLQRDQHLLRPGKSDDIQSSEIQKYLE